MRQDASRDTSSSLLARPTVGLGFTQFGFIRCRLLTIYTQAGTIASMARTAPPRAAVGSGPRDSGGMLTDAIALLQSNSLPALVQQELERMILSGELSGGAKLTEVALARRLGVSRGPVREAFRGLEELGLVRLEKN